MARRVRNAKLEARSSRLRLGVRRKPYNAARIGRGQLLLYRRNKHNGAWILKCSDGHSKYWTRRIADCDDFDPSDGKTILTYFQAVDAAKRLVRGDDEAATTAPTTVRQALVAYKADLLSRGADPYNASAPLKHLTPLLLSKPVALLDSKELKAWRDSLLGKLAPASINRVCNSLCAALELARQFDPLSIKSADSWELGLAGLPNAQTARNVVLPDKTIHRFVAAAYAKDHQLGLFCDTLATTGARSGQVARLLVDDLHASAKPRVMMPKSAKGGGRNRSAKKAERYSVPVTVALSRRLKAAAAGRAPDAPLLLCADGTPWGDDPSLKYRRPIREVFEAIGEDPDKVTLYALRHSNIVRMLLKNIPIRLIASLHDTSTSQIERNYSRFITEHSSDAISRAGLLAEPEPAADAKIIPLAR
jgi:hypothetical protein